MPAPRGSHPRLERNLERNLETPSSTGSAVHFHDPTASDDAGASGDVAAKLARDAVQREAARRAAERTGVTVQEA